MNQPTESPAPCYSETNERHSPALLLVQMIVGLFAGTLRSVPAAPQLVIVKTIYQEDMLGNEPINQ